MGKYSFRILAAQTGNIYYCRKMQKIYIHEDTSFIESVLVIIWREYVLFFILVFYCISKEL